MPDLWVPGIDGPHDALVEGILREIRRFADETGIEKPVVDVELSDTGRFCLDAISADPGYGFVTLRVHSEDDDEVPDVLIVPVASLRRIELRRAAEEQGPLGFTLPPPA